MKIIVIILSLIILGYWAYVMSFPEPFQRSKIINEHGALILILAATLFILGIFFGISGFNEKDEN
jgi:hypothetical protein